MSSVADPAEAGQSVSGHSRRQQWLSAFAHAGRDEIAQAIESVGTLPVYRILRAPESGMVMLRGRAGGSGQRFNLGEATVTRCSIEIEGGAVGHGYVLGRDRQKAERVALLDALLQDPQLQERYWTELVEPLMQARRKERLAKDGKTAATKVEFFTMVRGDNE